LSIECCLEIRGDTVESALLFGITNSY